MLGYVHSGQPTVILRVFVANAWICAQRATDRDLESVSAMKKVNAWICACQTTDRDLESVFVKRKAHVSHQALIPRSSKA